jgi:DNA (cytosine-5)-methyltransferase 1
MYVIDFFSGCGGTSCGFQDAGMKILAGLDIDRDAASSFQMNFPDAEVIVGDIRKLDISVLGGAMKKAAGTPVLFSGCAPCQPFSKQNMNKGENDPRRTLLDEFWRFIDAWEPTCVFVENVPGLQRPASNGPFPRFVRRLRRRGYAVAYDVVPALWYGVPQQRERLVLIGTRAGNASLPAPTHGPGRALASTVRDWIADLPRIDAGTAHDDDVDHRAASLSALNMRRIASTPEGMGREAWPRELWLDCHKGHKGHSDVYGRLAWDRPAAGLTTRCISYSNGRFGHPEQNRALSLREAACLQTFPRDYRFCGSLVSKARQVGNAVPPLLAKTVGEHILNELLL